MIIGLLLKIEDCLTRGQDSRNLLYWKKSLQNDRCGPGIFGQKLGQKLWKPLRKKKNRNGAIETPKLENARTLKGIYSIDPNDEEYKHIIKNARNKLEIPMADPMPCRRSESSRVTRAVNLKRAKASEKIQKMKFDCNVEAHESKRPRMDSVKKKNHEDHKAGKG